MPDFENARAQWDEGQRRLADAPEDEQRMLERAHYLVVSELAAVCRQPECNVEPRVNDALALACARHEGKGNGLARRAAAAGAH